MTDLATPILTAIIAERRCIHCAHTPDQHYHSRDHPLSQYGVPVPVLGAWCPDGEGGWQGTIYERDQA